MSDISSSLAKVLVREFYRLNAGFFILIITLTFGFMSGVEHKALAEFFVASPTLLLIPIAVWAIYCIKVSAFNMQRLALKENEFLHHIPLLPLPTQFSSVCVSVISQCTPFIAYATFLALTAIKHQRYQILALIIVASLTLVIAVTVIFMIQVRSSKTEKTITLLKKYLDVKFAKPIWNIYLSWLIRKEPVMFVGTKIFACVLIFAITKLYAGEDYDWRLMAMGTSLAATGNFMILSLLIPLERIEFQIVKNMPITLFRKFLTITLVIFICILPEMIFTVKYFPDHLGIMNIGAILIFMLSIPVFISGAMLIRFENPEGLARTIFAFEIVLLVLILFSVPLLVLAGINFLLGWILFSRNYFTFELPPSIEPR